MNTNSTHTASSGGVRNGLLYLLVGGGIGAAVALLFAPKSGTDLRGDISGLAHRGYDGAKELAENVKTRSTDLLQTAKDKRDQVYDFASQRLSRAEDAVDAAQEKLNDDVLQIEDKVNGQKSAAAAGRRSSSIL